MPTLMKDIVCFANTVHNENCYIIFGVSDDFKVVGMINQRKKQADIIDAISNLNFAGDNYPQIKVSSIVIEEKEIDVLTILDTDKTPIYLNRQYGAMRAGNIYVRSGDKNTSDNGNATMYEIENLWKKRFGLTKSHLEYIYDKMNFKLEWSNTDNIYYNIYKPEYTIEEVDDDDNSTEPKDEFYSYSVCNEHTTFKEIRIKYQNTVLETVQIVLLDGARLTVPVPTWEFIHYDTYGINPSFSYKYYVEDSNNFKLLRFLYNDENSDERYAFGSFSDVVLIFHNEEEKARYDYYINTNKEMVCKKINSVDRYNYITTSNENKTQLYIQRLHTGYALVQLLFDWRKKNE